MATTLLIALTLALAACGGGGEEAYTPDKAAPTPASPAAGTRPAGAPRDLVTVEGRIGEGAECPVVETPGGKVYALARGDWQFRRGSYVRIEGEAADASFCMEGEGTIIPLRVTEIAPSASGD